MDIVYFLVLLAVTAVGFIALLIKMQNRGGTQTDEQLRTLAEQQKALSDQLKSQNEQFSTAQSALRKELTDAVQTSVKLLGDLVAQNQRDFSQTQTDKLTALDKNLSEKQQTAAEHVAAQLRGVEERIKTFETTSEQKLEGIRNTVASRLSSIQEDNAKKLDEIRVTVDEKLQKTLESRISESFKTVSERLREVYEGLGEMKTLASGVGDLKKVLSNVKTRGILGEIQLGAILSEILSPEQYETDFAPIPGKSQRVEFAVKLPGDGGEVCYLPIDSKFPADAYEKLQTAYENGVPEQIQAEYTALAARLKSFAKDIRTKYIEPPHTTAYGIMFLPFEGLYAEVVNRGLFEQLQNEFQIMIAGPTTMAALLNSLQMGFRTLALQKRSTQVWQVLGAVKSEFEKFEGLLVKTQKRLTDATNELDQLVGVRTRAINKSLRGVEKLEDEQGVKLLELFED
ncbi:MAG: DNA recombination protein RmuC [Oscillospiraceae bacterium]